MTLRAVPRDVLTDDEKEFLASAERERLRQVTIWGGPEHDDSHGPRDWICFVTKQLGAVSVDTSPETFKERMIKVAALAMAAYASASRFQRGDYSDGDLKKKHFTTDAGKLDSIFDEVTAAQAPVLVEVRKMVELIAEKTATATEKELAKLMTGLLDLADAAIPVVLAVSIAVKDAEESSIKKAADFVKGVVE